jgi:single-strand DNA-binding protein
MASLNHVILVGNLVKDPEPKFLPSGANVCNLRIATNRTYKDGTGAKKEEVTYVSIEVWGKGAEACGTYLKKGSSVLVEGRLKMREWEKDGQKHSTLEVTAERVQFLDKKADRAEQAPEPDIPF